MYRVRIHQLAIGWQVPEHRPYSLQIMGALLMTAVLGLTAKLSGAELPEAVV